MADRNVNAAAQHFAAEESAREHACYRAAQAHGLTPEQADECDDFDKGCPTCPFKRPPGVMASEAPQQTTPEKS